MPPTIGGSPGHSGARASPGHSCHPSASAMGGVGGVSWGGPRANALSPVPWRLTPPPPRAHVRGPAKVPEKWIPVPKNGQNCPFHGVSGRGTYHILFAAQFYVDPLSFIGFGGFSRIFVSKDSSLSSQHGLAGNGLARWCGAKATSPVLPCPPHGATVA